MNNTKKKDKVITKKTKQSYKKQLKIKQLEIKKTKKLSLIKNHYPSSHHFNHKIYDRKSDILKFQFTPKLRGGKFIDKGGFGCVITPALPCTSSDKNLDKSVSKIIKHQSNSLNKELKISNMLKKLDPLHKFYITIDKYCFINEIPEYRTDLTNVKYKDEDLSKYNINSNNLIDKYGKKKKIDKHFCDIELDLKPVNLIMPYAGISLSSIMKTKRKGEKDSKYGKDKSIKSEMHRMFVENLKVYFKHLVIGLLKMHNNRIVNKDIKQRNIMLDLQNDKTKQNVKNDNDNDTIMTIRYIDFGLSEFLSDEFCKDITNIGLKGTPFYLSPELFICAFIIKYKDRPESYKIKVIKKYITDNVIKALDIINEKEIISKMNSTIESLYKKIKFLYEKDKLLETYFGSEKNKYNGYIQKADVYALGLSIYETLYKYSEINVKQNEKLYDLLLHMIDMNPDKRYNIVQCLSHPYFTRTKNV
jgi:serine/threonine protein kinase